VATAADTNRKTTDAPPAAGKRRSPLLLTTLVAVVAAAGAGAGVWYYNQQHNAQAPSAAAKAPPPAHYFALDPAFVVNLPITYDGPRYLQVEVQLMTRDPLALEKIRANAPAIRARLLMFFAQTDPGQITDRAGMEALQNNALSEVQELLKSETGSNSAEALLFTSFVTQ
jgi:flagellar FliL protein